VSIDGIADAPCTPDGGCDQRECQDEKEITFPPKTVCEQSGRRLGSVGSEVYSSATSSNMRKGHIFPMEAMQYQPDKEDGNNESRYDGCRADWFQRPHYSFLSHSSPSSTPEDGVIPRFLKVINYHSALPGTSRERAAQLPHSVQPHKQRRLSLLSSISSEGFADSQTVSVNSQRRLSHGGPSLNVKTNRSSMSTAKGPLKSKGTRKICSAGSEYIYDRLLRRRKRNGVLDVEVLWPAQVSWEPANGFPCRVAELRRQQGRKRAAVTNSI
jgi:hypothetical protein